MVTSIKKQYNIYKTTNLVNGRFYWGVHDSIDENDGYLGSGKILKQAIKKYSKDSFKRKTMVIYETAADAFFDEGLLVTQKYLDENPLCYNVMLGGRGGWSHVDNKGKNHPMYGKKRPDISVMCQKRIGENNPLFGKTGILSPLFGTHRPEETKARISASLLGRMTGENNPMSLTNRARRQEQKEKKKC